MMLSLILEAKKCVLENIPIRSCGFQSRLEHTTVEA